MRWWKNDNQKMADRRRKVRMERISGERRREQYGLSSSLDGTEEKLKENFDAVMEAIIKAKPSAVKGQYLRSITLTSTMGPGVKVNTTKF